MTTEPKTLEEILRPRRRRIAKERIAEQFGDIIKRDGAVVVDCGLDIGHAVIINNDGLNNIYWLGQDQVRTLVGDGSITGQFGHIIKRDGVVVVDCGPERGTAVVIDDGGLSNTHWLKQSQVRTLAGRID